MINRVLLLVCGSYESGMINRVLLQECGSQEARMINKYLSGNNLPQIKRIRGKLFPDRYLPPFDCFLISVAFVVLCRAGCLWVTGVICYISRI